MDVRTPTCRVRLGFTVENAFSSILLSLLGLQAPHRVCFCIHRGNQHQSGTGYLGTGAALLEGDCSARLLAGAVSLYRRRVTFH
jgi:hypothetical protein